MTRMFIRLLEKRGVLYVPFVPIISIDILMVNLEGMTLDPHGLLPKARQDLAHSSAGDPIAIPFRKG